ncbi:MAG: CAP domain-containing protein [Myxococcota bacterium]
MPRTPGQSLVFLVALWASLAWLLPLVARGAERAPEAPALEGLEARLFVDANRVRGRHRRIPLLRLPALDRVARAHSADMATRSYLSHENPEGESPVDRIERGGITGFTLAAENAGLTSHGQPVDEILAGWQTSPDHRRNLLAPAFNATGVGAARAADGTFYFTQLYVTFPRAARDTRPPR